MGQGMVSARRPRRPSSICRAARSWIQPWGFCSSLVWLPCSSAQRGGGLACGSWAWLASPFCRSSCATRRHISLRAIGLTLPIALVCGWGALTMEGIARRRWGARLASLLPLALIVVTGTSSYRDFHSRWLQNPEVPIFAEVPINQAINFMREHVSSDTPVFFSPFTLSHPVLAFRGSDLAPRRVGAFDSHQCMVIPDGSATYFSLTRYEPAFELDLSRWADLTVLHRAPLQSEGGALYTVFQATTRPGFPDPSLG